MKEQKTTTVKYVNYKSASRYYLIGNLFNKGLAFLTVPIFTRILSTSDYGILNTFNSWVGILGMLMGFALHMSIRIAYIDYRQDIDRFTSMIMTFTILSSTAISGVIAAVLLLFRLPVVMALVAMCMLQGFSSSVLQDYDYYLMMQYKYRFRTFLMVLPNLIATLLSILAILCVFTSQRYLGSIIPTTLIQLLFSLFVLILVFRKSHPNLNREYLKYGLLISAPLIVHGIALNILAQSDRIMITWLASSAQTGIYSLIYNFSMVATVLTSSLDGIWVPWFMEKLKNHRISEINQMAINYVNLVTYLMVCLIFVAPEGVKLLSSRSYWAGICIIPPVVTASYVIFIYTFYVNVEHFYKKTPYITLNTLIAASTNIILNYFLIPKFGYAAAAFTTLVSYLVSFVLHSRYAKKLVPEIYPFQTFIRPFLHIGIATILFYLFMNLWIIRWSVMLLYCVAMLIREKNQIIRFSPRLASIMRHFYKV